MTSVQETNTAQEANGGASTRRGRRAGNRIDPTVFGWSIGIITVFCILGALFPKQVGSYAEVGLNWIIANLGWLFVLAASAFVVFCVLLAFSRYGRIPLSRNGEPPEFSTVSWIAMMFSAGMGIGLIFYGVAEPVLHLANPAPWLGVQPGSQEAANLGMGYTFFHWGLHPWAIYAVVALALAYSTFRMGRGNLLSAPFQALLGKRRIEDKGWGKPIDIWAIIATKFGGAVSLGLGALQIAGGIWLFTGIGSGFQQEGGSGGAAVYVALVVIVVLVTLAILSAVSGVGRGIKWLSNTNMVIAALLVLFVLVAGPTAFLLNLFPAAWGSYIFNFIPWSAQTPAFGGTEWLGTWTIFYWAWWISWAPFVATFIARISRGRTIREFVLGVLIVPTVVSSLWFTVFGGAGMDLMLDGQANIAAAGGPALAFFNTLQLYPLYIVTGIVVMFLVAIFWVSGADASALVLGMLSSQGATEPKRWLVALWAGMAAALAGVLLWVGGLQALKTFTILIAAPFVLVMIGLCWALYADLRRDPLRARRAGPVRGHAPNPAAAAPFEVTPGAEGGGDGEQRVPATATAAAGDGGQQEVPASATTNGGERAPEPAQARADAAAEGDR